ncbi:MAG TPA: hypothetical protein VIR04_02200 [Paralcaligenes sp.]|jgi:hypothetical protein
MNAKLLLGASLAALAVGFGGAGVASAQGGNPAPNMQNQSTGMGGAMGSDDSSSMGQQKRGMHRGRMQRGMMDGCPMMGGMMDGMMDGMMGWAGGANAKVMMQMHGEMMRAMGDIMIKYADKIDMTPPVKMP